MVALYVFSLVLGGGFLALSVFGDLFGGHGDVEFDGHLELDAGGMDLDMDVGGMDVDVGDMDLDVGGMDVDVGHLEVDAAHAELSADAGSLATKILSVRTVFYSFFGFGAVGSLLTFVWSGNPFLTAAFAVVGGLSSGAVINTAFGWVRRSESGGQLEEAGYAGVQGRVILPIRPELPGRVIVERGGCAVRLRALPHASAQGDPTTWKRIFVVEMERGIARVAPFEEGMLLEP
jgi:hypothetical protein